MDQYTATEVAYKNGYEAGKRDAVKWTSVEERLPEETGVYLVHDIPMGIRVFYFAKGEVRSGWGGVTHWMPLPEPPMNGGNEDG